MKCASSSWRESERELGLESEKPVRKKKRFRVCVSVYEYMILERQREREGLEKE